MAVLRDGRVSWANEAAMALGDLAALAGRAAAGPIVVTAGERAIELSASSREGAVALVGRDVTDREALRRALARSDEILRVGAHELRNPLHVIGMICHLLETRSARAEPLDRSTVDRLRRQMNRLDRLINQLLDLSRVQDGRLVLDLESGDLVQVVREQLQTVDPRRAGDLHADLPEVAMARIDRPRIGETVRQLLENAVRFTEPGTPITLSLREDGGRWRIDVSDRGPGIGPEDLPTLFQRNVRLDRQRGPQGLGLGLYIAANVVRLHGGTLAHEPVSPSGARFLLRLPKA